jgi:hypothetical protein
MKVILSSDLAGQPGMRRMGSAGEEFLNAILKETVEFISYDASVSPDEWKAGTINWYFGGSNVPKY